MEWFTKERSVRLCSRVLTAARAKTNPKNRGTTSGRRNHPYRSGRPKATVLLPAVQRKGYRPLKKISAAGWGVGVEWFTKERSVRLCSRVLTAARAKTNPKNRGTTSGWRNHPHRSEVPRHHLFYYPPSNAKGLGL